MFQVVDTRILCDVLGLLIRFWAGQPTKEEETKAKADDDGGGDEKSGDGGKQEGGENGERGC